MRKLFLLIFLFWFGLNATFAQENRKEKSARIEAMRVTYFTESLALTDEEAEAFWPVFNEYEAKRKKIRRSFDRKGGMKAINDETAAAFIEDSFLNEQKLLDLKREYFAKFVQVVDVKKVARLPKAEKRFRQELIKHIKHRRENRGN